MKEIDQDGRRANKYMGQDTRVDFPQISRKEAILHRGLANVCTQLVCDFLPLR